VQAEDGSGALVDPASPLARRWSALAALEAVWQHRCRASQDSARVSGAFQRASLALRAVTGDAERWNRAPGRTHEEVIGAFERAIGLCEEASPHLQAFP
jgi:hypothetical protein